METEHHKVETVSDVADKWGVENVPEFTEARVAKDTGAVMYYIEVDEVRDGKQTGAKKRLTYVYLDIDGKTLPAKFGSQSVNECAKVLGRNPDKWVNKIVIATYANALGNDYLIWKPKPKVSGAR